MFDSNNIIMILIGGKEVLASLSLFKWFGRLCSAPDLRLYGIGWAYGKPRNPE